MGKSLTFLINGVEYSAEPFKLERKKLYGWRENIALDDDGAECALISMSECGTVVIPKGGTGLGFISADGKWVDRSRIKTVKQDGSPAEVIPSSYGDAIVLDKKAAPEELLDCFVTAIYHLDASLGLETSVGNDIYQFDYCYRDGYEAAAAFLLASEHNGFRELFMLAGEKREFSFIGYDEIAVMDGNESEDEDDEGEIDFQMF